MLAALERHLAGVARWNRPSGGMFVWLELPEGLDAAALVRPAVEREAVAFSPGEAFCAAGDRAAARCLRLCFANNTPEAIEEGVARLARAVGRAVEETEETCP
jgi:2-aminoadipate transaminase